MINQLFKDENGISYEVHTEPLRIKDSEGRATFNVLVSNQENNVKWINVNQLVEYVKTLDTPVVINSL